ncbi:hypothetical protein CR513_28119, partial [Mucuna pruriens]
MKFVKIRMLQFKKFAIAYMSPIFVQILKVVGEYGKGLKSPTYHEVRVSFLKEAIDNIHKGLDKYKSESEK